MKLINPKAYDDGSLITSRPLLLALWLTALSPVPASLAAPASGMWSEHTEVLTGGVAIQTLEADACYPSGSGAANPGLTHVERLSQRLIDPSCAVEVDTKLDSSRFNVRCGGPAFGDGLAILTAADDRNLKINISFHNYAADMDTEYTTSSQWLRPQCDHSP